MNFSVLMSIYDKEDPAFFDRAMQSLWDEQKLKPSEIVLVEDGKLTGELYDGIDFWENKLGGILKRVPLKENQGLGRALNIGLGKCKYEYVARMDTDDICTPDRFDKQIAFLKKHPDTDILGGQLQEFNQKVGDLDIFRKLPSRHDELTSFAKKRCPFNHPTVIYKKSCVQNAGGYGDNHLYEDYPLWVRMITQKVVVANLPNIVLYMRAGNSMAQRRGGIQYAVSEVKAQYSFYQMGFLSFFELMRNLIIRFPIRVMPNRLRVFLYKKIVRKVPDKSK